MAKAKAKPDLQGVTFVEGDAEDIPLPTDAFDRYTSAGSIEYWPEPQRGVCEAYRILKPGGWACLIGPVEPTNPVSKFFQGGAFFFFFFFFFLKKKKKKKKTRNSKTQNSKALWMLFPSEQNYLDWFRAAGFVDVELHRIGPKWYRGVRRHGLIMGCSVVGRKPASGPSPLASKLGPKEEVSGAPAPSGLGAKLALASRVILGSAAGFYYFVLPVYFWIKNLIWPRWLPGF